MKLSCEIIKDLLPLYIDELCSDKSKNAIEEHFKECENCKKYYFSMKENEIFQENENQNEQKMTAGLKNIKSKINKRIIKIVMGAISGIVCYILLFNVPIKKIDKNKVSLTAQIYPIDELPHKIKTDNNSLKISLGENDNSDIYQIYIPELPNSEINVSEDVAKKNEFVTVISTTSDYFLRKITQNIQGDTLYITAFKTTILNNKAEKYQKTMTSLEFKQINKIVYSDNGKETVLWEKK